MDLFAVFFAILPILVIIGLLVLWRKAADVSGLIGWIAAVLIAVIVFKTPLQITLLSSLAGVLASLPIALVVGASILQVTFMIETGAISRVIALIKTISPQDKIVQIMLINIGLGTMLTALGAVPVSILPPIMIALGYSSFVAIALPALGYDALTTYALLGIPVVVFAGFVGQPVEEVGGLFARFIPVVSSCIALGMLYVVGKWKMVRQGFFPAILSGVTAGLITILMNALHLVIITGIAAGLGVVIVMLLYLKLSGKPLVDRSVLSEDDLKAKQKMSIWQAASPWILLTIVSLVINIPSLPFFEQVFIRYAMPVEIIPGQPEKLRLFWQAYFWILITTLLAFPFIRPSKKALAATWKKWIRRAPRPMLAAAVFFAIAFVLNHSGKNIDWELFNPDNNMIVILASAAAALFSNAYPLIAPFLGLLGGFVSGSETSSIAMLTDLHLETARQIGVDGYLIAAASGIGGGLASVISPAKLQNASAAIDRIGEETSVIRLTFMIALVITAVVAIMTMLWV